VLETGRVRRVGGEGERSVDVRLLSATHRDLAAEVEAGRFRADLYYRLRGAEIRLPPLRERGRDLDQLLHHFLGGQRRLGPGVRERLGAHGWPGNVRELAAEVRRWLLLTDEVVRLGDLSPELTGGGRPATSASSGGTLAEQVAVVERAAVAEALRSTGGNASAAARQLGIDRHTLARKRKALRLSSKPL
jgi:DNA-binding NtrC family response regulator